MKDKYELHFNGHVEESDNFATLKKMVENTTKPYEIFVIKESKMNKEAGKQRTLDDVYIEKALELIRKGRTKHFVAALFHVHPQTLSKSINAYDQYHKLRPVNI